MRVNWRGLDAVYIVKDYDICESLSEKRKFQEGSAIQSKWGCEVGRVAGGAVHVVLEPLFGDDAGDLGGGFVAKCGVDREFGFHTQQGYGDLNYDHFGVDIPYLFGKQLPYDDPGHTDGCLQEGSCERQMPTIDP